MKRKRVFKGWAGRSGDWIHTNGCGKIDVEAWHTKGTLSEWGPEDWPPVRVRVTVEVVDKQGKDGAE
jgi:hypothetical protein